MPKTEQLQVAVWGALPISYPVGSNLLIAGLFRSWRWRNRVRISLLLEFAERHSIPVACDLDDYLFDDEAIPCSESLSEWPPEEARSLVRTFRDLVLRASYYTGTTDHLIERALAYSGWNRARAAAVLGLSKATLRYRIEKFRLKAP